MRTILRVGISVGGIAFVVLYPLQSIIGLAAAAGIVLAGIAAGLGVAKWLPRPWYGRQFAAGIRTGVIAVCMAGVSVTLASLTQGTRSVDQLAATSHALGLDLGPLISHLAGVGLIGTTIAVVVPAMLLGAFLGVLAALMGAWGKNHRAIQVVNQARLAAQTGMYGDASVLASAAASGWTAHSSPSLRAEPVPAEPLQFQQTAPALPAASSRSSKARPADSQLTDVMREALATWAADNVTSSRPDSAAAGPEEARGKARAPLPSAYLNSTPPASSKRARKKQNTEWLR